MNQEKITDLCVEYVFDSPRMNFETIMFVSEKDGSFVPVKTLFKPDEIISVQSAGLDVSYAENIDYTITDDGITPIPGTNMPYFNYEQYFLDKAGDSFPMAAGHLVYNPTDGAFFHNRQIAVSYRHSEKWDGPIPKGKSEKLPKTLVKIKREKKISVLFNGDSITTGANSSGCEQINVKPYILPFPDLFVKKIEKTYNVKASMTNIAVGGTQSSWGIEQSIKFLTKPDIIPPDLYIIGFGMNDGSGKIPACDYIANTRKIIDDARSIFPDCEFILIATMLPNPVLPGFAGPHPDYENPLLDLENEYSGVAVANMTEMHKFLLTKKRYQDMTGNNVNHPNDFLARIYAQVLLKTFGV